MASCFFGLIFGVTQLWPPVLLGYFLEGPGCGLLYFLDIFWSDPVVASCIFGIFLK